MSTATQTPNTALAVQQPTSPLIMELAERWRINPTTMLNTLKATVFPQKDQNRNPIVVSNEQMIAFLQVANEYRLNPFLKELYAFPTKGGGIVPMVPVDGWANIVNRNPQYDGIEFKDEWIAEKPDQPHIKSLFSTTCVIHRKDRSHPTVVTEYMQECYNGTKDTWKQWPARMLRHKAFIQCARLAFSLAGIYDPDEAERIAESGDDKPKLIERPKVVEGTVNLDAHTAKATPATQPATQAAKCLCTCCQAGKCDCASKNEFDRCGCSACTSAKPVQEEKTEAPRPTQDSAAVDTSTEPQSAVDPGNSPNGGELFQQPGQQSVDKKFRTDVKKLMAIAKTAFGTKDYEAKVHDLLRAKFGITSLKEIPVGKYDEICELAGKSINAK